MDAPRLKSIPVIIWPKYILSKNPVILTNPRPKKTVPTIPKNKKLLFGDGKINTTNSKYRGKGIKKAIVFTKTVILVLISFFLLMFHYSNTLTMMLLWLAV